MRAPILGAVALLLAACTPLRFSVDSAFTPDENAQILKAAHDWNVHSKRKISFDGDSWRILKQDPGTGYNGWSSSSQHLIRIRPEHPGASVYEVALHEFGHALGLKHTTTGLMQAAVVNTEFTPEVLAECRRVGAC